MYKIKKVPSPTGYTILESEIEVNSVDGIQIVYESDGELRGKISIVSIESELEISYDRKYKNGKSELLLSAEKWMLEKMILAYQKHQCLIKS